MSLQTELSNDPLQRGYAGMTDAECAADLNEKRYAQVAERWITERTIMAELADGQAIMEVLETVAEQSGEVARAVKWLDPARGGLNIADAKVRAQIDDLATAQLLTQQQAEALKALAEQPASRAEVLGLGVVHHLQIAEARNGDV